MALYSAKVLDPESGLNTIQLSSGQIVSNSHSESQCYGEYCPLHEPTNHALRDLPLAFTGSHMVRLTSTSNKPSMATITISGIPGNHTVVIDPDDYSFNHYNQAIIRNSGYCMDCGTHLISEDRHDFKECKCGESFVDGGSSYMRRSGRLLDTSLVFYNDVEKD